MTKKHSIPMTISVVVAAYNEEKYLPNLLKSLKKQTRKPDEIIIVDNNSTDQTATLAKKFGAKVVRETTPGYVHALNSGLTKAKGEILAVTDADTILPPHWIEAIAKELQDPKTVAVTGPLEYESNSAFTQLLPRLYTAFLQAHFLLGKPHITGTSMAFRKSTFDKIGGMNTLYEVGADVEIGLRMKKHGKVRLVRRLTVLASHRRWEKNASRSFSKYAHAYVATVWLKKPPRKALSVVR
jgi:glycosyltransferase involved in cell wall biosynthesis